MKKISTVASKQAKNFPPQKLTVGLDLGDRWSWYCVLDEAGKIRLEQLVSTTSKAVGEVFGAMPRSRIALEIGTHSPWISRLLSELGHEVIVANARKVRLIAESRKKDDRLDAQTLARLARIDPQLLYPVKHRSVQAQADLTVIRARAGLVRARTALVNTARGLAKSYGERLRSCNVRNLNPEKAESLSPELQAALEPLLKAIESLSERIESLAQQSYPQVALLKQIKGVGTLIGLTFLLTLEDPHRFRKSRDVGCYLGLQPGRRNSGQSEPQMHISKEGDPYLRTLLVQGAQHILGPFGPDCDLRRWGSAWKWDWCKARIYQWMAASSKRMQLKRAGFHASSWRKRPRFIILWPRAFHLRTGKQSLYLPRRPVAQLWGRVYRNRAFSYIGTRKKVRPVLAQATMHQCCLPGPDHPPERTRPTTCTGVGQHARVRQSTAAKKEGGSLVRGTQKSDRIAALASAETQVRARAVLPGSGCSEHQTTGALPQSADNTVSAGHHVVERRQQNRRRHTHRRKGVLLRGFFNSHRRLHQEPGQ